jgi:hypothetical protein
MLFNSSNQISPLHQASIFKLLDSAKSRLKRSLIPRMGGKRYESKAMMQEQKLTSSGMPPMLSQERLRLQDANDTER